jgi:hypothetical protein
MKTLVVNLFAGPGTGKSTCMAGIFSELKLRGVNCEMAPEYIKTKVWENSLDICKDQIYIFGKQLHSIRKLLGKVDVVITDSPILLSLAYSTDELIEFDCLVIAEFKRYNSLNYFLVRHKKYNPAGRCQTEEQAKEKDNMIKGLLDACSICYTIKDSCKETIIEIVNEIEEALKNG